MRPPQTFHAKEGCEEHVRRLEAENMRLRAKLEAAGLL